MNEKEKAIELVDKYKGIETFHSNDGGYTFENMDRKTAKKSALLCVDEIIKAIPEQFKKKGWNNIQLEYWENVKEEINNL